MLTTPMLKIYVNGAMAPVFFFMACYSGATSIAVAMASTELSEQDMPLRQLDEGCKLIEICGGDPETMGATWGITGAFAIYTVGLIYWTSFGPQTYKERVEYWLRLQFSRGWFIYRTVGMLMLVVLACAAIYEMLKDPNVVQFVIGVLPTFVAGAVWSLLNMKTRLTFDDEKSCDAFLSILKGKMKDTDEANWGENTDDFIQRVMLENAGFLSADTEAETPKVQDSDGTDMKGIHVSTEEPSQDVRNSSDFHGNSRCC